MNFAVDVSSLDSGYINAEQLQQFKRLLLQQKADVVHKMDALFNYSSSLISNKAQAVDLQQQVEFIENIRIYEKVLTEIDQALSRIESGKYGYCQECGGPVGIDRLLTSPTQRYDAECESHLKRLP